MLRYHELDAGFLVHCGFGFHYFEVNLDQGDFFVMLDEFFGLLVDELLEFLRCIEVNGFNLNFHVILLFLVPLDGRVCNY